MIDPIRSFPFLADDHVTLAAWTDSMAQRSYQTDLGDLGDAIPEAFFATLPGSDQASFVVWRSLSSSYVVSDLRDVVNGFVETVYMTLSEALASMAAVVGA